MNNFCSCSFFMCIHSLKNVITLQMIYSDIENVVDAQGGAIAL